MLTTTDGAISQADRNLDGLTVLIPAWADWNADGKRGMVTVKVVPSAGFDATVPGWDIDRLHQEA